LKLKAVLLALFLAVRWAIEFANRRRFEVEKPPWLNRAIVRVIYLLFIANWIYLLLYRREDPFGTSWLGLWWANLTGGA